MENVRINTQNNKLHPHKLMMWMGMGSMFMLFAGLTSAFILQKNSPNWFDFTVPLAFWFSTIAILASSFTMHKAVSNFKQREMAQYKKWVIFTVILGFLFIGLQCLGFADLYNQKIVLNKSASSGFLFVISGLHITHVIGAIIALVIVYFVALRKKIKVYNSVSIEVMSIFWHFVDGLWVYLFLFFLLNFKH